jgi:hypothetical protein
VFINSLMAWTLGYKESQFYVAFVGWANLKIVFSLIPDKVSVFILCLTSRIYCLTCSGLF